MFLLQMGIAMWQASNDLLQQLPPSAKNQISLGVNSTVSQVNAFQNAVLPKLTPSQRLSLAEESVDILTDYTGDMFKKAGKGVFAAVADYINGNIGMIDFSKQMEKIVGDLDQEMNSSINRGALKVLGKNITTYAARDGVPAIGNAAVSILKAFGNLAWPTGTYSQFADDFRLMAEDFLRDTGIR